MKHMGSLGPVLNLTKVSQQTESVSMGVLLLIYQISNAKFLHLWYRRINPLRLMLTFDTYCTFAFHLEVMITVTSQSQ